MSAPRTQTAPTPPAFAAGRAIAVLRGGRPEHLDAVVDVLVGAGLRCLEITTNTPDWAEAVTRTRDRHDAEVRVGVGTVITVEHARRAAAAGAEFALAPDLDADVGEAVLDAGLGWVPGALTPSEIVRAWRLGASAVKVFPADALGGPAYVAAVRAPLEEIPLIPTGGVGAGNAAAYLDAGAVAVGLGSSLLGSALDDGDLTGLDVRVRAVVEAVTR